MELTAAEIEELKALIADEMMPVWDTGQMDEEYREWGNNAVPDEVIARRIRDLQARSLQRAAAREPPAQVIAARARLADAQACVVQWQHELAEAPKRVAEAQQEVARLQQELAEAERLLANWRTELSRGSL